MACQLKILIGVLMAISVITTFALYKYNGSRILQYSADVFQTAAVRSTPAVLVFIVELLVLGAHAGLVILFLSTSAHVISPFETCQQTAVFLAFYIVQAVGMVGWPMAMPQHLGAAYPDGPDVCELLAATGSIGTLVTAGFYGVHTNNQIVLVACLAYLAAKYVVIDGVIWGLLKHNTRRSMKVTSTSQKYVPLHTFT